MKKKLALIKAAASMHQTFGGGANFVQRTIGAVKQMGLGKPITPPVAPKSPTVLSTKNQISGNSSLKRQMRPLESMTKQPLGGVNK